MLYRHNGMTNLKKVKHGYGMDTEITYTHIHVQINMWDTYSI